MSTSKTTGVGLSVQFAASTKLDSLLSILRSICACLVGYGTFPEWGVLSAGSGVQPAAGLAVQQQHAAHSYITPTPAYLPDTVDKQWTGQ